MGCDSNSFEKVCTMTKPKTLLTTLETAKEHTFVLDVLSNCLVLSVQLNPTKRATHTGSLELVRPHCPQVPSTFERLKALCNHADLGRSSMDHSFNVGKDCEGKSMKRPGTSDDSLDSICMCHGKNRNHQNSNSVSLRYPWISFAPSSPAVLCKRLLDVWHVVKLLVELPKKDTFSFRKPLRQSTPLKSNSQSQCLPWRCDAYFVGTLTLQVSRATLLWSNLRDRFGPAGASNKCVSVSMSTWWASIFWAKLLGGIWSSDKTGIKKQIFYCVSKAAACTLALRSCSGVGELVRDSLSGSHWKQRFQSCDSVTNALKNDRGSSG